MYCDKINRRQVEWFNVDTGLKQGCILSTPLFNIFINDITRAINELDCGVKFISDSPFISLYADDTVLLSDNVHNQN